MDLREMILKLMIDVALERGNNDNNHNGETNETNHMEEPTVGFNRSREIGFLFHDLFDRTNKEDEGRTVADTSTTEKLI